MAQILALTVVERQDDWDAQLPHVEFADSTLVSAAIGLTSNEFYMGRLPRLPLAIIAHAGVAGHQNMSRDQLTCLRSGGGPSAALLRHCRDQHAITLFLILRWKGKNIAETHHTSIYQYITCAVSQFNSAAVAATAQVATASGA